MADAQGFFSGNLDPSSLTADELAQQAKRQRLMGYAQSLMQQGSGDAGSSPYGGLANAGRSILGAYLTRGQDAAQGQLINSVAQRRAQAMNAILNPQAEPQGNIDVTPRVNSEQDVQNNTLSGAYNQGPKAPGIGELLARSSDPSLIQQFGPALLGQRLAAERPPSQYEQQQLALQQQRFGLEQQNQQFQQHKPQFVQPGVTPVDQSSGAALGPVIGGMVELDPVKDLHLPKEQIVPGAKYYKKPDGTVTVENLSGAKSPTAFGQDENLRSAAIREQMNALGLGGPGGAGGAPAQADPNSNSILAQTGLSNAAYNALAYGQMPRGQIPFAAVNKEIDEFANKNGINTATLRAQAKGYNDVLTSNLHRNNQGNILENEIQGTVQNLAPLADAVGAGKINVANIMSLWAGKQVNDPTVQQYRDQLLRLREELAGYNAVAGGKLTESGTARVDDSDLRAAEAVINNGINSGGLRGLAASISASTGKNRAVLGKAIDDANQNMWGLFGVGKNYKRQYDQQPPGAAQPGARPQRIDINGNPIP